MRTQQKLIGALLLGLSLILVFLLIVVKLQSDKEGAFLCQIVENDPNLSMEDCPAHESNNTWAVMGGFFISTVLGAIGVYLIFFHATQAATPNAARVPQHRAEVDMTKLDDEEKRICELLQQHEGSMYQSDLIKETEFTKVRMTRLLDKLETKQVIERKRRGMTNIVVLR